MYHLALRFHCISEFKTLWGFSLYKPVCVHACTWNNTEIFTQRIIIPSPSLQCSTLSSLSSSPYLWGLFGHHRWFCKQFPPFSPVLHCPLGLGKLQACPFPDVVFPPLPLSALFSSPFHCALQGGFGQTWWTGDMTIPLQSVSLYDGKNIILAGHKTSVWQDNKCRPRFVIQITWYNAGKEKRLWSCH